MVSCPTGRRKPAGPSLPASRPSFVHGRPRRLTSFSSPSPGPPPLQGVCPPPPPRRRLRQKGQLGPKRGRPSRTIGVGSRTKPGAAGLETGSPEDVANRCPVQVERLARLAVCCACCRSRLHDQRAAFCDIGTSHGTLAGCLASRDAQSFKRDITSWLCPDRLLPRAGRRFGCSQAPRKPGRGFQALPALSALPRPRDGVGSRKRPQTRPAPGFRRFGHFPGRSRKFGQRGSRLIAFLGFWRPGLPARTAPRERDRREPEEDSGARRHPENLEEDSGGLPLTTGARCWRSRERG